MKRYEYCIIDGVDNTGHNFNSKLAFSNGQVVEIASKKLTNVLYVLGEDGWEMVGCGSETEGSYHTIYFKREL